MTGTEPLIEDVELARRPSFGLAAAKINPALFLIMPVSETNP
jgi:hypothetical protein